MASTKTKTGWKKAKVHENITLPSGTVVDLEIPNLAKMLEGGTIPNKLIGAAIALQSTGKVDPEVLKDAWEFAQFIVPQMVKAPTVTAEDVNELPFEDVELLVAFASRSTDMDAVGKHLGGLHRVQSFRDLRGIFSSDPDLLSDEGSGEATP